MRRFTRRILDRGADALRHVGRWIYQSEQERQVAAWIAAHGDKTLRLEYDLNEESIVFDLGGYEGQWTSDITAMYCCTVHVFEPVPEFAANIQKRFERNPKVHVHTFGLAGQNRTERIYIDQDASSTFQEASVSREIKLVSAFDFICKHNIKRIDLMKINIEGGEYELLEHLIDTGLIQRIVNIQVQFHDFVPDAERRMLDIQYSLRQTHELTYQYPFVWENWQLKNSCFGNEIALHVSK